MRILLHLSFVALFGCIPPLLHAGIILPPTSQFVDAVDPVNPGTSPRPTLFVNGGDIAGGVYDDFYTYFLSPLNVDPQGGVGNADVKIYSNSNAPNEFDFDGVHGNEVVMESSLIDVKPRFSGTWGDDGDQTTVGEVLQFLRSSDPDNSTPAFLFNNNQEGGDTALSLNGIVSIVNPNNPNDIIHSWSFDPINDGIYQDPGPIDDLTSPDGINDNWQLDPYLGTDPVSGFPLGNPAHNAVGWVNDTGLFNIGQGDYDYVAVAPTMDLSLFEQQYSDFLFVASFNIRQQNNGFELLGLSDDFTISSPSTVPEPGSFAVFGIALAFAGYRRRNRAAKR